MSRSMMRLRRRMADVERRRVRDQIADLPTLDTNKGAE